MNLLLFQLLALIQPAPQSLPPIWGASHDSKGPLVYHCLVFHDLFKCAGEISLKYDFLSANVQLPIHRSLGLPA